MNIEARGFFGEYGQLLSEWCVSAFCSATLDWIASKIPVRNGIFATLLSIGQITCAFYTSSWLLNLIDPGPDKVLYIGDNWLAYNTIILMSPTAIQRLTTSYNKLHFILYGPGMIPTPPGSDCASGNCSTTDLKIAPSEPQREKATELIQQNQNELLRKLHNSRTQSKPY
jgi:hypothetical protein